MSVLKGVTGGGGVGVGGRFVWPPWGTESKEWQTVYFKL